MGKGNINKIIPEEILTTIKFSSYCILLQKMQKPHEETKLTVQTS